VANPDIVDILPLTDSQFFVLGKRIGTTNAMLWNEDECPTAMILLEVTPDLELLKSRLHEVMPGERIEVRSAQGTLVMSGTASSAEKAAAAVQVAQ
jgi:pilus assembly protein CpaC